MRVWYKICGHNAKNRYGVKRRYLQKLSKTGAFDRQKPENGLIAKLWKISAWFNSGTDEK